MDSLYSGIFWASKQPLHYTNYACALGRSGRRCFWDTLKQWNKLFLGSESEADLSVDCSSKAPPPFLEATWNWKAPGKMLMALGLGEDAQAGWPRSCLTEHLEHLVVLLSDLRQPSNSRGLITLRSTDLLKDVAFKLPGGRQAGNQKQVFLMALFVSYFVTCDRFVNTFA